MYVTLSMIKDVGFQCWPGMCDCTYHEDPRSDLLCSGADARGRLIQPHPPSIPRLLITGHSFVTPTIKQMRGASPMVLMEGDLSPVLRGGASELDTLRR